LTKHDLNALACHLEGIHEALKALVVHLETGRTELVVRSQLEWSVSHLYQAIREIHGTGPQKPVVVEPAAKSTSFEGSLMEGLRGHSQAVTVPEILGFVASIRKSGVLRINSDTEAFLIHLRDGTVIYAQGDHPPKGQLLGEILVAQGATTQEQIDQIVERDPVTNDVLGKMMLKQGIVTREALCIALAYQVQCLFHRLFRIEGAVFQFDEGAPPAAADDIRLNVTSLLLESARSNDEDERDEGVRRSA
jgi:hypothetical protein